MNVISDILLIERQRKSKKEIVRKKRVYYLAAIDITNDTLKVRTIKEDFSVRKDYNSPAELKSYITDLLARGEKIFDSTYSLSYRKIPRPQPVRSF
jgi:hypothetical protein